MSEPSSKDDICGCSHFRFRHQYESEDGPCSKPDCDCKAYAPVLVEDVELPEPNVPWTAVLRSLSEAADRDAANMIRAFAAQSTAQSKIFPEPKPFEIPSIQSAQADNCNADRLPEPEGPECSEVEGCDGECCERAEPAPSKPEPRPPYAVAYSVEGQLYEAYIPGDASVIAMNGALVIQHDGRTVSGIVQVLPVRQEK